MAYLLEVDDLHTFFKTKKGIVKAVNCSTKSVTKQVDTYSTKS